jgi:hypothetical protein
MGTSTNRTELLAGEDAMAGLSELCMFGSGAAELRVSWDRPDCDGVEVARGQSEELRGKAFPAFRPENEGAGREGHVLDHCDPTTERITLI